MAWLFASDPITLFEKKKQEAVWCILEPDQVPNSDIGS